MSEDGLILVAGGGGFIGGHLVRDLVDLNYANIERYPKAKLSAVDVDEQLRELEIDRGLWSMGVSLSKEEVGDRYGRKPPVSKGDAITPQSGQQAAVGEVKREPGLQVDDKEALELDGAGEGDRSGEGDTAEHFSEGLHRFASTQFDLASDDADAVLGEWRAERDPELAHVRDALARQHWRLTGRHPS